MSAFVPKTVIVHDLMQEAYRYQLVQPIGKNFDPVFKPQLTPAEMLALGIFGGKYMTDCREEFPANWFTHAKLSPRKADPALNCFHVLASQPLAVWRQNGWINEAHDPRGWFQWYCRYFMGRRLEKEDARQIRRWRAVSRHIVQLRKNCRIGDRNCRPRQRQAILHWAFDSRIL